MLCIMEPRMEAGATENSLEYMYFHFYSDTTFAVFHPTSAFLKDISLHVTIIGAFIHGKFTTSNHTWPFLSSNNKGSSSVWSNGEDLHMLRQIKWQRSRFSKSWHLIKYNKIIKSFQTILSVQKSEDFSFHRYFWYTHKFCLKSFGSW